MHHQPAGGRATLEVRPPRSSAWSADGVPSSASITVTIARRPTCTLPGGCLVVAPTSGPRDGAFAATVSGIVADSPDGSTLASQLVYDFGLQRGSGRRELYVRSTASPTYTFAPSTLPTGDVVVLFACARGEEACMARPRCAAA